MSDWYRGRDAELDAGDLEWRSDARRWEADRPQDDREPRAFGAAPSAGPQTHRRHRGYRLGPYGHAAQFGPPDYVEPGRGYGGGLYENAPYARGYGEDRFGDDRSHDRPRDTYRAETYGDRYDDGRGFQGDNDRLRRVSDGSADHGHLFGGGTDSHRGRGPKGYSRSDERIHDDVADHLTADHLLDASDIEVAVKDGEVTLSGHVARREDRRRAEDLAERVLGVKHVQNNLRVQA